MATFSFIKWTLPFYNVFILWSPPSRGRCRISCFQPLIFSLIFLPLLVTCFSSLLSPTYRRSPVHICSVCYTAVIYVSLKYYKNIDGREVSCRLPKLETIFLRDYSAFGEPICAETEVDNLMLQSFEISPNSLWISSLGSWCGRDTCLWRSPNIFVISRYKHYIFTIDHMHITLRNIMPIHICICWSMVIG